MRKGSVLALLTAGTALSLSLAAAPAALAATAPAPVPASHSGPGGGGGGRPGGQPVTNDGFGSLGTAWHLKSMHDDLAGAQVVGEEFEIDAPDPQNWTITLADNGVTFPFAVTPFVAWSPERWFSVRLFFGWGGAATADVEPVRFIYGLRLQLFLP